MTASPTGTLHWNKYPKGTHQEIELTIQTRFLNCPEESSGLAHFSVSPTKTTPTVATVLQL